MTNDHHGHNHDRNVYPFNIQHRTRSSSSSSIKEALFRVFKGLIFWHKKAPLNQLSSVCPTTDLERFDQCVLPHHSAVCHSVPYHSLLQSTTMCPTTVYHGLPQSTIVWYSLPQCTTMYPTTDLEDSISVLAEKKHPWTVSTPRTEIFPIGLSSSPSLSLSLWWGLSASSRNVLHHSFLAPLIAPCCYIHLFIHFHHHHFSIYYWASRSEFDRKGQKTGWTVWALHAAVFCKHLNVQTFKHKIEEFDRKGQKTGWTVWALHAAVFCKHLNVQTFKHKIEEFDRKGQKTGWTVWAHHAAAAAT